MKIKLFSAFLSLVYIVIGYAYGGFELALLAIVFCGIVALPMFFPSLNRWVPAPWTSGNKSYYGVNLRPFYSYIRLFVLLLPLVFLLYLFFKKLFFVS